MSLNRMLEAVANRYQWQLKDEEGGFWMLYDPQNDIHFSVELTEDELWTWLCSAVVLDINGHTSTPNPVQLLRLNDGQGDEGVIWCFFAIGQHEHGESLYLKYGAMTPLGDLTFASRVIATALRNMQKFTVRTRGNAL